MKHTQLGKYQSEVRHALRIGAPHSEYLAITRKLSKLVTLIVPTGELVGNLAGFAFAWNLQGRLNKQHRLDGKEGLNAQGLEGAFEIEMPLYDAVMVSMQTDANRVAIKGA